MTASGAGGAPGPGEAIGRRPISVLVADEEEPDPLVELLRRDGRFEVVGHARDAGEAARLAGEHHPDVALLSVTMPAGGGARAAREITWLSPRTRVMALWGLPDRDLVFELFRSGAQGCGARHMSPEDLMDSLVQVAGGGWESEAPPPAVGSAVPEPAANGRLPHIRRVLDGRERLAVVFQPVFDLSKARVVSYEALARFPAEPADRPAEWFRYARQMGVAKELEAIAVSQAISQIGRLPADALLAVNVSPETALSPALGVALGRAPLERVVLEVVEPGPGQDPASLERSLRSLRARGLRLAIDEAGAHLASLQYLLRLMPDYIKVDRSLVRRIHVDPLRQALASALAGFAAQIGASSVAVGIESRPVLEAVRALGIPLGQGFYLGRPPSSADGLPARGVSSR